MTIIDSTVWIDIVRGIENQETLWYRRNLSVQRLGLTDLILMEVLRGTRDDAESLRIEALLRSFQIFDSVGVQLAVNAAHDYRTLRASGVTVRKSIDCLIATFCIQRGYALLHHDRDFDHFERELGLHVVHP